MPQLCEISLANMNHFFAISSYHPPPPQLERLLGVGSAWLTGRLSCCSPTVTPPSVAGTGSRSRMEQDVPFHCEQR